MLMDISRARQVLGLPEKFDETLLKKRYHNSAIRYHPDKNKDPGANEKFQEIKAAYEYLLKNKNGDNLDSVLGNIFKTFTTHFVFPKTTSTRNQTIIHLTALEYLTGAIKQVVRKKLCECQPDFCNGCSGCGFSDKLDTCMDCTGDGYTKNCGRCVNGYAESVFHVKVSPRQCLQFIDPVLGGVLLKLENGYFVKENMLCCHYNITLKESLTGFNKTFKDPFGKLHTVFTETIVKTNDGYRVADTGIVLVFNVIYPKQLPPETVEQIKTLIF
jgi:DnaJ-class molecular chaperone